MKSLINKITNWEAWPFSLLYAPIAPIWIWYIIRSRAVWFFTPSNPKITFGGLEGEPKKEMYDLLPKNLYPKTIYVLPNEPIEAINVKLRTAQITFPLVAKPEVGWQGILFRKLDSIEELVHYHKHMPIEYIVQELVEYPMEVSVFYIRHPQQQKGMVTGFLHKIPLQVKGDGKKTLQQLVSDHPKGNKRLDEMFNKHKDSWNKVVPANETYMLSYAANHNRGAQFVDLKQHIDDKLVAVFDNISLAIDDFFYGRYDIMCSNVEELKQGRNFTILEYNGCGAEPNHFYDTGYSLAGAYREILKHWKWLYRISRFNSRRGIKPWPYKKGMEFLKASRRLTASMQEIDKQIG